jgi:hypothetical protein
MRVTTPDWLFPETRANIVSMINFVADQYIDDHADMELDVTVGENKSFGGLATVIDDDEDFPMQFEIDLDDFLLFEPEELMITVAHEMIHIKQFASGELRNCPRTIKYKNKYYRLKDGKIDPDKYREYPWEQEAYEMEGTIYKNWASHNR